MNAAPWLDLLSQDETKEQKICGRKKLSHYSFLHYEQKKHFNIYRIVHTQLLFVSKEKETPFFTLPKILYELDG